METMLTSRIAFLALACAAVVPQAAASTAKPNGVPKLVLTISIDQFRADYLNRFRSFYLPAKQNGKLGGFNYLLENSANYTNAHISHVPTATGPGHASIMTGSTPATNGIVGNDWYDRKQGKAVYCVDDPSVETIGGTSKPMSPRNLKVTTISDELEMATNGRSKTVSISFKDRAAILLAGHAADTVIWYDNGTGNWVTSSFYAPSKKLPDWVAKINDRKVPDSFSGQSWTPLLADDAYKSTRPMPGAKAGQPIFTHKLDTSSKKAVYKSLTVASQGQEFVFSVVKEALKAEQLGQDEVPDVLTVNLATNDYIGHVYGPNSPEVMDISVRTDRLLSDLLNTVDKSVPGGIDNVAIVITADHGVLPIVEEETETYKIPAVRVSSDAIKKAINVSLGKAHGDGNYVLAIEEENLYLDRALLAQKNVLLAAAQKEAADAAMEVEGIHSAFSASQIARGELPRWDWLNAVSRSYFPSLSGDVFLFTAPGSIADEGTGTGHGSPWAYDSHIPLLVKGPGVRPGTYSRRVGTVDIAPTLAQILRIEQPSGCMGEVLREALDK